MNPERSSGTGLHLREAGGADHNAVVGLTRASRHQLATWAPVYFRPRAGADDAHAGFLGFLLASPDHETWAIADDDQVIGFFQVVAQPSHYWIDDLCIDDGERWAEVVELLLSEINARPLVTCVSNEDEARSVALTAAGLSVTSSYWARSLNAADAPSTQTPAQPHDSGTVDRSGIAWPRHTFGGAPFVPEIPGALVVADGDQNLAIGSPGVEPPIYDPGGPTTVVDAIGGPDPSRALTMAIGQAFARGDAQLVVVARNGDEGLKAALAAAGFQKVVNVFATPEAEDV